MRNRFAILALCLTPFSLPLAADEGLWLFNQVPKAEIKKRYGFNVSDDFLNKLRLGSVRFNNGGSGSFISGKGLLFTNHHVGIDCIQKVSSATADYVKNGFYAPEAAAEKKCPDLEVNVLLNIEDVTDKVTAGITASTPAAEANQKRKQVQSALEKECADKTGNRCDVVTLYAGGRFHLYQYKKYSDVRLVFAPEFNIAFFGGDPDNFTYPRYNLDFALFRAYENGQPVKPAHFFPFSRTGAKNGELTFVSGHPGTTGRLLTMSALEFSRDVSYPFLMDRLSTAIASLEKYMAQSDENRRAATDALFGLQNSLKAYTGFIGGLRDPQLMAKKRDEEARIRKAVADDPAKAAQYGKTWDEIDGAFSTYRQIFRPYFVFEGTPALGSELMTIARQVVRYAAEKPKPNAQRLREYSEAGLPSLEQAMYSTAPITPTLEITMITQYLEFARKSLGAEHPVIKEILAGRSPAEAATVYVTTSQLTNVAERKRLANSWDAIQSSNDGMIRLALLIDKPAREYRKQYEDQVEAITQGANAKLAQIRFALYGDKEYPDATFTLRLSYAKTIGYTDAKGAKVPWATDFAGLFARATGKAPYELPARWLTANKLVNLQTPFNFVSTHDTHGGNSGSPTVNTKGEIVGILFDGNIEGLPNRFVFTDDKARSVHVASQGIVESLRKVYKADRVLKEMLP